MTMKSRGLITLNRTHRLQIIPISLAPPVRKRPKLPTELAIQYPSPRRIYMACRLLFLKVTRRKYENRTPKN